MKKCWIVFEDDLRLNSNKVSKVFLNKDKAEGYLQNKIDTQPDDDMLVWTILKSELDEELDNKPLLTGYEDYIPELGDRVQLSDIGYKYLFNHVGKDHVGTVYVTRITSSEDCFREMEIRVKWDNGVIGQYPMSFVDKASI